MTTVLYSLIARLDRTAVHIMAFIELAARLICSRAVLQRRKTDDQESGYQDGWYIHPVYV